MPSFVKVIISFLIVVLISIIFYLFFFSDIFNIKQFDFINAQLETKMQKELSDISSEINNFIFLKNKNSLEPVLKTFDFNKFIDKKNIRETDVADEFAKAKNLIVSESDLEKIKLFDNKGNLIFSTDIEEEVKRGQYVTFVSKDGIEKRDDFYNFNNDKLSYMFDSKSNMVILKKNIIVSDNSIGLMLFYFKDIFLNDILRRNNFIDFKKPYFINNIIILSKPQEVPEEYLFNFNIQGDRIRSVIYRDKSGNEIEKLYRLFYVELKQSDIVVCRFIDNDIFILDKRKKSILFFIFVITLYLLILAIFLFKKSEFEKAKEKSILFTVAILDEMLKARSREDLEKLHRNLKVKKENAHQDLIGDIKKLNSKDKKVIEEQIDIIFNKIEESFEEKLSGYSNNTNTEKLEMLFEKFADTIAEKGININAPISFDTMARKEQKSENVELLLENVADLEELDEAESVDEVEELEELDEAESIDEVEGLEEVDGTESPEEVEELEEIGEADDIEEIEEIEEAEELDEIEPVEELDADEVPKVPVEFYDEKEKDDELADKIKELSIEKTALQLILESIYNRINGKVLSLLINSNDKYTFLDVYQIGTKNNFRSLELNKDNVIIQRIFSSHRMVYVRDSSKFKDVFQNDNFAGDNFDNSRSFFIYPISIFGKIKALIIISFAEEKDNDLESIIDIFEENKKVLRKEVVRLN